MYKPYQAVDSFTFDPVMLRPKSRGYVKLRTANPYDHPIIDPRYLTHPDDIHAMVEGMKVAIAIGLTPAFQAFGAQLFQTIFPGCEAYSFLNDEYLGKIVFCYYL